MVMVGLVVMLGSGRAEEAPAAPVADEQLQELVSWMSGSFSSAAQARADQDYLDIRMHLQPIWSERSDGRWLYVEQATVDQQDQPYRQRIYQITRIGENLFEVRVFSLPDPGLFVGAWEHETPLADLAPESLIERQGCSILIRRHQGAFVGSTIARLCPSKLGEAAYATSEVTISRARIESWDRGWKGDGTQVWGAVKQPYLFDRAAEVASEQEPVPEQDPATEPAPEQEAGPPADAQAQPPGNDEPQEKTPATGGESEQESTQS
jgi:hypothetical protein